MEKRQIVFKGKIETIGIVEVKKHFRDYPYFNYTRGE
jgi:hypothetical protein